MAPALGPTVTAEGIKIEDPSTILRKHRCDRLQRYLFGVPTPARVRARVFG